MHGTLALTALSFAAAAACRAGERLSKMSGRPRSSRSMAGSKGGAPLMLAWGWAVPCNPLGCCGHCAALSATAPCCGQR